MRAAWSKNTHPTMSLDSAPFWQACRAGHLSLPTCGDCGKPHLPPGPVCPFCLSDDIHWERASGFGTVASWVVYHRAFSPEFENCLPYNAALIELEEV